MDGRSIASVGTEEDDLPSEVEETIDVIESGDGSVAELLNGQITGDALRGREGLEETTHGEGNMDRDELGPGLEGGADAMPLTSQDVLQIDVGEKWGEMTKGTERVSYSRRKRVGEEKHSRIMEKLNLTMVPIRKQLALGCISRSTRLNGEPSKKGKGISTGTDSEVESEQANLLKREARFS